MERDSEAEQTNRSVAFIVSDTLMYSTAVLQRVHSDIPPPPRPPSPLLARPSRSFGLIDVWDGEAGIPAFCSFKERVGEVRGDAGESDR